MVGRYVISVSNGMGFVYVVEMTKYDADCLVPGGEVKRGEVRGT